MQFAGSTHRHRLAYWIRSASDPGLGCGSHLSIFFCYLKLTTVNVNLRRPSATYTRINQLRLIPRWDYQSPWDSGLGRYISFHPASPLQPLGHHTWALTAFPSLTSYPPLRSPPSLTIGSGHHPLLTIHHLSLTPLVSTFGEHYSQVTGLYWLQACTLI